MEDLPPFLPPRRPQSLPNLQQPRLSWHIASRDASSIPQSHLPSQRSGSRPRKLAKRRQQRAADRSTPSPRPMFIGGSSRPNSFHSTSSTDTAAFNEDGLDRTDSNGSDRRVMRNPQAGSDLSRGNSSRLAPIHDGIPLETSLAAPQALRSPLQPPIFRESSLRLETRLSQDELANPIARPSALQLSFSEPRLIGSTGRPYSHPVSRSNERLEHRPTIPSIPPRFLAEYANVDPWRLSAQDTSRVSTPSSQKEPSERPRASLKRLSSLDNLLIFKEERAEWKRASSILHAPSSEPSIIEDPAERPRTYEILDHGGKLKIASEKARVVDDIPDEDMPEPLDDQGHHQRRSKFRHRAAEIGFCFTIAMTQLLGEYLITGFATELTTLLGTTHEEGAGGMGLFWPAALLSLILSATLFIFARLSDMFGGYPCFMFGVFWLGLWTLIPGFSQSILLIDVSRAMQGLAIAAYMPSTFTLVGSIYPEGPRRNVVMGLYSGCAPLGFFAGFLVAGSLPEQKSQWYFWIASIVAFTTVITAYLTVPHDTTDRRKLGLKMDWIGAFLITGGLILFVYALSVEPYMNESQPNESGFQYPACYGPLIAGIITLLVAFWYEGWKATCPLLPFDFFTPRSVKALSLGCLCFYASFGVWLYNSAEFFQSASGVTNPDLTEEGISGIKLAIWYAPTAIGGIILCVVGGLLLHIVPVNIMLLISALAWIAAPLLLALAPLPINYWAYVMPSMLCATIGIDLTYTVSIVFFSSVQPLRYQGLSGAVASSILNLAMSFALPISEIVMKKAQTSVTVVPGDLQTYADSLNFGFKATLYYAAASAGLGLVICVLFVRISRSVVSHRPENEGLPGTNISDSTLVEVHDRAEGLPSERSSQRIRDSV